jgi:hypothetical protein
MASGNNQFSVTSGGDDTGGNRSILANGVRVLSNIAATLAKSFPQVTGTTGSATAGAATLPANPVGFITITLPDGTTALVPYYSP